MHALLVFQVSEHFECSILSMLLHYIQDTIPEFKSNRKVSPQLPAVQVQYKLIFAHRILHSMQKNGGGAQYSRA